MYLYGSIIVRDINVLSKIVRICVGNFSSGFPDSCLVIVVIGNFNEIILK